VGHHTEHGAGKTGPKDEPQKLRRTCGALRQRQPWPRIKAIAPELTATVVDELGNELVEPTPL